MSKNRTRVVLVIGLTLLGAVALLALQILLAFVTSD
jgi:hypothetical protein